MKERLRGRDYRFIAICLVLFAAATWYAAGNFYRAFPEASIDFRAGREEARQLAAQFLAHQGYGLQGYRQAASFTYDDSAKTFLEREAGLDQANRIMGSQLHMWRWSYRWFRPRQQEEFRAEVATTGELAGFSHILGEDASRPDLTAAEARARAEDSLRALGRDPETLEFVESNETARPHRIDRVFTWRLRGFNLHDATHRVEITMLGSETGGYREYLKVPDQWTRDYELLRSRNQAAQTVDTALLVALVAGLLVVIVLRMRRHDVRWRRAAIVGSIGVALAFCSELNQFPLAEFDFPTADSYSSFLSRQFLEALMAALGAGGLLFILAAGAEPLYREANGNQISLGNLFRPRGLRTRRFLLGSILGITLTAIFIAYQTVFYIVAYRYGAWSPADVPYDNLLNTRFPFLFVLFGGYFPAVSEEFLFRMFAIPFLRKLVRWLPLAVVLAAFTWGFGHAGYPQQPFYIRGVEVGIGGVALGIIMLRWGVLPTLVWHYSVDAMYSAMLLVRSHNLYLRLSGAASAGIIVLPVAVALIAYWRSGGFEPDTGLLNSDEPPPAEPEPAPPTADAASEITIADYRPLSTRVRIAAVAVLLLGLAALAIPATRFAPSPQFSLGADQARTYSDAFLRSLGADPTRYRYVAFPDARDESDDLDTVKYFLEREPTTAASARVTQYRPVRFWVVRYYRPLDEEEFLVTVHPETGRVMSFRHVIPEDRPGADIPTDQARAIATAFALANGVDLSGMDLKDSTSERKKARRDHTLVWEARPGDPRNLDEARFRVELGIVGDQVASWRAWWKLPEAFERDRSRQNWVSIATTVLRLVVTIGAVIVGIWLLALNVRRGLVPWRTALSIAIPFTLLIALSAALLLPQAYRNYPTTQPLATFQALTYTGLVILVIGALLVLTAAAALVTSFFPEALASLRINRRRVLGLDALFALLAAAGLGLMAARTHALIEARFHAQALVEVSAPALIASAAPAISAIAGALRATLIDGAIFGVLVVLFRSYPKYRVAIALLALTALVSTGIHTPGEFALQYAGALIFGVSATLFCLIFARRNALAYALVFFASALRVDLTELFGNSAPGLHLQGWIVAAVLTAAVAWVVAPSL